MVNKFSLSKNERLSSRKVISSLFEAGHSVYASPVRMLYKISKGGVHPASMAVSVPKRLFKNAVDRNLLKRRIREAYRLNKHQIYDFLKQRDIQIYLLIQYNQKDIMDYGAIELGILAGFQKIKQEMTKPRT